MRFRLQSDGAAGEIDQDNSLAGIMQALQEPALYIREFKAGAVSTQESGNLYIHLLSFQAGRYASRKYHNVNPFQLFEQDFRIAFFISQAAASVVYQVWDSLLQGVQKSDGRFGYRVIIAPLHFRIIGIWPQQRQRHVGRQRQQGIIVLQ